MGIVLLVIGVLVALVLTFRALRSYEAELRRTPGATGSGGTTDPLLFEPFGDSAPHGNTSHTDSCITATLAVGTHTTVDATLAGMVDSTQGTAALMPAGTTDPACYGSSHGQVNVKSSGQECPLHTGIL